MTEATAAAAAVAPLCRTPDMSQANILVASDGTADDTVVVGGSGGGSGGGSSDNDHGNSQSTTTTTMPSSSPTATTPPPSILSCDRSMLVKQIAKHVVRQKLQKLRHLVVPGAINTQYLDGLFPQLLKLFEPQTVTYNGGVANIRQWKISCYLEVMDGGVPCTNPHTQLLDLFRPLLETCNDLFLEWYRQQHACNNRPNDGGGSFWERRARQKRKQQEQRSVSESTKAGASAAATDSKENQSPAILNNKTNSNKTEQQTTSTKEGKSPSKTAPSSSMSSSSSSVRCHRLMTFITRYTAAPDEQALLKHVDGAGKVDGSVVVALPIDRWSASYETNSFEGHGGGLTFWDGKERIVVPSSTTTTVSSSSSNTTDNTATASTTTTTTTPTTTATRPREIHYDTRSGDIAFIDKAVWHQADPITKGTRWALVIFYKVINE